MKVGSRLLLLLCLMAVGLAVASVASVLVANQGLLAMLTLQDVLAFIAPALVAMAFFYLRPLVVMGLDRAPGWKALLVVVAFYILSMPAMNWLVSANEAMTLPQSMSGIEQAMRSLEDSAAATTRELLDISSLWQLVATVLVVGVLAGLSEEILFRGAMLRTMQDSRLGTHAVVWITAIIFSACHMQFFGFFPRMVLGVWLGYLLVWTGSLWVPIIAHALNNSTVVLFSFLAGRGVVPEGFGDNLGLPEAGGFPWMALASFFASLALALWAARRLPRDS